MKTNSLRRCNFCTSIIALNAGAPTETSFTCTKPTLSLKARTKCASIITSYDDALHAHVKCAGVIITTTDSSVSAPSVLTTPQRKQVKPTHSPPTNDKAIFHLEESLPRAQENEQTHQTEMAAKLRALNKQLQELRLPCRVRAPTETSFTCTKPTLSLKARTKCASIITSYDIALHAQVKCAGVNITDTGNGITSTTTTTNGNNNISPINVISTNADATRMTNVIPSHKTSNNQQQHKH